MTSIIVLLMHKGTLSTSYYSTLWQKKNNFGKNRSLSIILCICCLAIRIISSHCLMVFPKPNLSNKIHGQELRIILCCGTLMRNLSTHTRFPATAPSLDMESIFPWLSPSTVINQKSLEDEDLAAWQQSHLCIDSSLPLIPKQFQQLLLTKTL